MNLLVIQTMYYLEAMWLSYHLLYLVKLLTLHMKVIRGSTTQTPLSQFTSWIVQQTKDEINQSSTYQRQELETGNAQIS